ncbi:alkaline phosphatase family protein [Chryseolinea lacunae]|uniref:Alkaline phosphatase family protein n=1 Tax=Chryseolinea lacunae TaxID=2801331 RepID=A0ABS1KK46_9BACT|nr:alkaline phosphatase family protein [Chryseolinea lacunae]MBL0739617.1 alkaline phosphatase family protein [Chryseolinea lacunae]
MKTWIVIFMLTTALCYGQSKPKTENVVLITLDGFRWQEMFGGADSSYMKQQQHLKDDHVKEKYWKDNAADRRKTLFPFVWNTIGTQGQLYGNRTLGSKVNVTNQMWFSYPGYNEILTGKPDDEHVNSNDKNYNANTTVLEFVNKQSGFKNKVAAFTSWDVFPYIINDKRSGVFVSTGATEIKGDKLNDREKMMNQLITAIPNPLGDVRLDAFTFYYGFEYLKRAKPRVMFFAFDETDDFAHGGEYAAYLNAAHATDRFIGELWAYLQSDDQYKGKTTLIITVDHGRGPTAQTWKDHGIKVAEADQIWLAVLGPDTPALGEMKGESQLYQSQVARTLAAFLGLDFKNDNEKGKVISSALKGNP